MINFNISTLIYSTEDNGSTVFRDAKTLGYLFVNTGNSLVLLNNILIPAGGSFKTFEPNYVDKTQYRMLFKPTNACSETNSSLTVLIYQIEL